MRTRSATALALSLLLLAPLARAAAAADEAAVTIERKSPTTRTRTFDPKRPPSDVKLTGNEAAYTRSSFQCAAGISYVVIDKKENGSRSSATIRVDGIKVELSLDNTLFLPTNATKKLTAHEQAHRQIAETVYESAGDVARRLATPLIGRTFAATAPTPEAAADKASKSVVQKLCDDYMATVPARSSTVNDIFDKITDHGRNRIGEADAIKRSFQQADTNAAKPRLDRAAG